MLEILITIEAMSVIQSLFGCMMKSSLNFIQCDG